MNKSTFVQNSLAGGEISPRAMGRFDYAKYSSSVKTLKNFLNYQLGGAIYRPGTEYIGATKDSSKTSRLIKFQYSDSQAYIIEVGDYYMRFFANGGQVVKTLSDVDAWITDTDYVVGDYVKSSNVIYYCVTAHHSGTFADDLDDGDWVAQAILEIPTPYKEADIFDLHYAQSADTIYITHGNYAPRKLQRTSAVVFTLTTVPFSNGPFLDPNVGAVTMTPSAVSGSSKTLTASVTGTFDSDMVGGLFRVSLKSTVPAWAGSHGYVLNDVVVTGGGYYRCIVGHTSGSAFSTDFSYNYWEEISLDGIFTIASIDGTGAIATGDIALLAASKSETFTPHNTLGTPAATTDWSEGAFSTFRGWPATVAFHKQRLVYANTTTQPQTYWASVVDEFDNFMTGSNDADAIVYSLAADDRNAIRWLKTSPVDLLAGTSGGTWSINIDTPTDPKAQQDTQYGSSSLMPKRISTNVFYVHKTLTQARELVFDLYFNSQKSEDVSKIADHILRDGDGACDIAEQQTPNDRIWLVRNDGEIAVMTRNIEEQVVGWSRVEAGTDSSGLPGSFESIAILQRDSADDEIWVVVKRRINGVVKRFVERFSSEFFTYQYEPLRLDCGLIYNDPKYISSIETPVDMMAGWTYREKIVIDSSVIDSSLTHFPIPIRISTSCGKTSADLTRIFTALGNNKLKIAVTKSDGSSQLYVQIKEWDATNKLAVIYVSKSDFIVSADTDTTIYLYYDPLHADNTTYVSNVADGAGSPGCNVWDSYFTAVLPLNESGATCYDATGKGHNGTCSPKASVLSTMGNVREITTGGEAVNLGSSFQPGTAQLTLEFLGYINDQLSGALSRGISRHGGAGHSYQLHYDLRHNLYVLYEAAGGSVSAFISAIDTYHYWVYFGGRYNGAQIKVLYGRDTHVYSAVDSLTGAVDYSATLDTMIGCNSDLREPFIGKIGEVRFSSVGRDDAWMRATEYSMRDELITFSGQEVNVVKVTSVSHGLSNDTRIQIDNVEGMTELNGNSYLVKEADANTFVLADLSGNLIQGPGYSPYVTGGEIRTKIITVTRLNHLEGEYVEVTVDGLEPTGANSFFVEDGQITLPAYAAVVQAGLPYVGDIQFLKMNDGDRSGVGQTKNRALGKITLRLYESLGGNIGQDEDHLQPLDLNGAVVLATGDFEQNPNTFWDKETEIFIRQDRPLPLFLLAIIVKSIVEDM